VGSLVGVTQVSDAFSQHDAVDGHEQTTSERVFKGISGTVQLATVGTGAVGKLPSAFIPAKVPIGAPASTGGAIVRVPQFASEQLLKDHYAKHVYGVVIQRSRSGGIQKTFAKSGGPDLPGFSSLADYKAAAQQLWTRSPGGSIVERTVTNGNRLRWNWDDSTFGVLSPDGVIRTYFRPDKEYLYFLKAK